MDQASPKGGSVPQSTEIFVSVREDSTTPETSINQKHLGLHGVRGLELD